MAVFDPIFFLSLSFKKELKFQVNKRNLEFLLDLKPVADNRTRIEILSFLLIRAHIHDFLSISYSDLPRQSDIMVLV